MSKDPKKFDFQTKEQLIELLNLTIELVDKHFYRYCAYYKDLTLKEALVHVGFMKNMPKQNIDAEVQKVLQQVNLSERQNDRIGTLSGGMLRRLGIAQAILGDPEVLIVDEPTVGLDPEERKHFRRLLADIAENRIVLISTHIVEDIAEISTELIVMKNGKIIAEGTANEALAYL